MQRPSPSEDELFRPVALSPQITLANRTGLWRYASPHYVQHPSPCQVSCPVGQDPRGWVNLVYQGKLREAAELVRRDNPIPSVCGRVCYHPCEESCHRGSFDEAIAIHEIERFLGDYGFTLPPQQPEGDGKGLKVAVVGSGPAGLACAYHLFRMGYLTTIFEAGAMAGGMLAMGIPEYRLPKEVLQKELQRLVSCGVEIKTQVRIGQDLSLDSLFQEGYGAVFLAIGAQQSQKLGISGEEATGIVHGLDFLQQVNLGERPRLRNSVAVIGGGNVAMDAARVARRLGAEKVTIFYRRSRKEMPASPGEVEAAEDEGVSIEYLAAPTRIVQAKGKVTGMVLLRMKLGKPDASGRRQPVPVAGSEFSIEAEAIIVAVGQKVEPSPLDEAGIQTADGLVAVQPETLATNRTGVFAGGDATTGPATIAEALGAGKRAALSIDSYLREIPFEAPASQQPVTLDELNLDYFEKSPQLKAEHLPPVGRVRSFAEVDQACSQEQILTEAGRCFSCGGCAACDNCWLYCPEVCISREDTKYNINYDYCKGCGICVEECPTGSLAMEVET